ncbi:tail fiber assembly protein [Caballeronia sp. HLA56]
MLIHHYHPESGAYVHSTQADVDPRNDGRWLIPASATADAPPERTPTTWPFHTMGAWRLLPDFRGRICYRIESGEPVEITVAGKSPEVLGLTDQPRPSPAHIWLDGKWDIDPALARQRLRDAAMNEYDTRMARARSMNAGRADAYAAGLLTPEQAEAFRAWAAYQLDLMRAVDAEGFPDQVTWPTEPAQAPTLDAPASSHL